MCVHVSLAMYSQKLTVISTAQRSYLLGNHIEVIYLRRTRLIKGCRTIVIAARARSAIGGRGYHHKSTVDCYSQEYKPVEPLVADDSQTELAYRTPRREAEKRI